MRLGLDLIDSVRDQQPLGAALGYQFERGLHENHSEVELDRFIDPLRTLYPLVANKAEPSVRARNQLPRVTWLMGCCCVMRGDAIKFPGARTGSRPTRRNDPRSRPSRTA